MAQKDRRLKRKEIFYTVRIATAMCVTLGLLIADSGRGMIFTLNIYEIAVT